MNRDEFALNLEAAFDRMIGPLTTLSAEEVTQPLAPGQPSLKEFAAHFVQRDQMTVRALETCFKGEKFDWGKEMIRIEPESAPPARVAAEWKITHSAVIEVLRRVPDERLLENGELPSWLVEEVLDHYLHHAQKVDAWKERKSTHTR